ncbi:HYC_CC_PP family protein [Sphingobacterium hotanense]|uniref:Uncharacterized protein n=1 Tax=Sphingobacterium hotanense TaxID=649196 RepID=A0ABT7NHM1_9SPHI|nr:hypothetical protein [Sphingobacterium hotanense]MDM1046697.1 hypothetical protein [Sphingobacterium hotanense]
MKKLFVIFLSMLYLVLSTGFIQYSHMCKGMAVKLYSLTNSNTHADSDKPCPICSNKNKELKGKKKGCCKHETKIVKVDNAAHKYSGFDLSVKFWGEAIPNETLGALFEFSGIYPEPSKPTYLSTKIPIRGNPLYILHCVYRI